MTIEDIENANREDKVISKIMKLIQSGTLPRKTDEVPNTFVKIWSELSVEGDLLLRGERLVISTSLKEKIIKVAHEGHMGIIKTKTLLRSKVWFPDMDKLVEKEVGNCLSCQATVYQHGREPLKMSVLPNGPWEKVKIDFFGPTSEYVLEIVDEYSRWVEVEIVKSTSAGSTIPKLDKVFATYGLPYEMTTDNGPPFNGKEIRDFAKYLDIKHRHITPYWPQANAAAENFNRCLRKIVQSAKIEKKNWKQEIFRFLRNYRNTPHPSTGKSPAQLMFPGRSYRTRMPLIRKTYDDEEIRIKDQKAKDKMKEYADRKRNVKESKFAINDAVLVKQNKVNKLTSPFNPTPLIVVAVKGSMVTAKSTKENRWITRNSSFFKKIPDKRYTDSSTSSRIYEDYALDDTDEEIDDVSSINEELNEMQNQIEIEEVAEENEIEVDRQADEELELPRRNPPRERNRPQYLRDDIENLVDLAK